MNLLNFYVTRYSTELLYTGELIADIIVIISLIYFWITRGDKKVFLAFLLFSLYNIIVIEAPAQAARVRTITETYLFNTFHAGFPILPIIQGFFEGGVWLLVTYHFVRYMVTKDKFSLKYGGTLTIMILMMGTLGALKMNQALALDPDALVITRRPLFPLATVVMLAVFIIITYVYFFLRKNVHSNFRKGVIYWHLGIAFIAFVTVTPLLIIGTRFIETVQNGEYVKAGPLIQILTFYGYQVLLEAGGLYLPVFIFLYIFKLIDLDDKKNPKRSKL